MPNDSLQIGDRIMMPPGGEILVIRGIAANGGIYTVWEPNVNRPGAPVRYYPPDRATHMVRVGDAQQLVDDAGEPQIALWDTAAGDPALAGDSDSPNPEVPHA